MNSGRRKLARRRRRLIYNNDGDDLLTMQPAKHGSAAEALLWERTTALLGSQVDSVWYYSTNGMRLHHSDGPFGRLYGLPDPDGIATENYRRLVAEGKDALEVMIDVCRQQGIEVFYSNRMNDCHDSFNEPLRYYIRTQHPEWSLSTLDEGRKYAYPEIRSVWTAWNFEIDEIRELTVDALREVARTYDIDGIELDFWRHLCYFPESMRHEPVSGEHLELFTEMVRQIRTAVDEEADKRGRPILLAGRCVEDEEISRNSGLDIKTWLSEGLVDMLSPAYGTEAIPPIESLVELAHRYDTPVYPLAGPRPKISAAAIGQEHWQKFEHYGNLPAWRGVARGLRAQGADGLQLFNFFNPTRPQWWELGEDESLEGKDTLYEWDFLPSQRRGYETFADLRNTRDRWPVEAGPQGCEPLPLFVGEDLTQPLSGRARSTVLSVHVSGLTRAHELWLTVNGRRLSAWRPAALDFVRDKPADMWIEFQEGLEAFEKGRNDIRVYVRPSSASVADKLKIDRIQLEITCV